MQLEQFQLIYTYELSRNIDNLQIFSQLENPELAIANRKLVFEYFNELMSFYPDLVNNSIIDGARLLFDVVMRRNWSEYGNLKCLNCVGLSCVILTIIFDNPKYNMKSLLSIFTWPNYVMSYNEQLRFIIKIVKSADWNILLYSYQSFYDFFYSIDNRISNIPQLFESYSKVRFDASSLLYPPSLIFASILLLKMNDSKLSVTISSIYGNSLLLECMDYIQTILKELKREKSPTTVTSIAKIRRIDTTPWQNL